MPNDEKDRVEIRSVSLYPIHWATVDAYAKDAGFNSTSAGIRQIITEWVELKKAAPDTEAALTEAENRLSLLVQAVTQALTDDGDGYDARAHLGSVLRQVTHTAPLFGPAELSQIPGLRKGLR